LKPSIQVFENPELLIETLAGECASSLLEGGTIVFGGGVVPLAVCGALSSRTNLPWRMIQIFPADEAFLPKGHPERNETRLRMVLSRRTCLLQSFPTGLDPDRAASEMQKYVRRVLPFDMVVLEMSPDGSVGALAPGSTVWDSPELVSVIEGKRTNLPERLVLTPRALSASERVVICATGDEASETLKALFRGDDLPPSMLRPLQPVAIYADREAASGLES